MEKWTKDGLKDDSPKKLSCRFRKLVPVQKVRNLVKIGFRQEFRHGSAKNTGISGVFYGGTSLGLK